MITFRIEDVYKHQKRHEEMSIILDQTQSKMEKVSSNPRIDEASADVCKIEP